jgi:hypothetical protein
MQTVKTFVFGRDRVGTVNHTPLDDQINEYLENHPGYSVSTMSVLNAVGYQEAFVVFNIREERKFEPKQDKQERQDRKNKQ